MVLIKRRIIVVDAKDRPIGIDSARHPYPTKNINAIKFFDLFKDAKILASIFPGYKVKHVIIKLETL